MLLLLVGIGNALASIVSISVEDYSNYFEITVSGSDSLDLLLETPQHHTMTLGVYMILPKEG
jgi:predicted ATP-grasp superfamily ATP-dependent carboligase